MANSVQRASWDADPEKIPEYVQLGEVFASTRVESKLWVELPDCKKDDNDSVPLADDVSNATSATCKTRAAETE
jgi:hypothetical protein